MPAEPVQTTMAAMLAAAAELHGDAACMVEAGGRTLSFIQFHEAARTAARAFIAAGVLHGDRLAIWAPNSVNWAVAASAMQMIGAILVPLNTRFKGAEAAYILRRVQPKLLLTTAGFMDIDYIGMLGRELGGRSSGPPWPALPGVAAAVLLDDGEHAGGLAWSRFCATQADDAALDTRIAQVTPETTGDILFTSGTTGSPKGAMHSQGQSLWVVGLWNAANDLRAGDRQLVVNPYFHSFGYRMGWVSGLAAGMTTWPMAVFDPIAAMELIARARITVLMGPPTLFTSLLDHPRLPEYDLSSLRVAHTGASNVPVDLIRRLRNELGFDLVLTSFGLTESTALVSANRPGADFETIAGTVGAPLPGVELHIEAGAGELLVRGPNVMQGYYDDPAATAATIDADGWLHTGDVGCIGQDGNLRILDRIKDVVIVGGFNAYPAEIENALCAHDAIAEVAIFGVPDPRQGEVCAAAIVLRAGQSLNLSELAAWSNQRLANFKVPRHLMLLDKLPRTALGKTQKFVLRARFMAGAQAG